MMESVADHRCSVFVACRVRKHKPRVGVVGACCMGTKGVSRNHGTGSK
jgi:hypothetical protein